MPVTTSDKRATFRKMHESGCFIIPNPLDAGSAKALQHLGFKALASTSAGFAWTIAKADNRVTVDDVCDASRRALRGGRYSRQRRFRGWIRARAGQGRRQCRTRGQDRRRRAVDRGLHPRSRKAAFDRALAIERIRAARARRSMPTTAASCSPAAARRFLVGQNDLEAGDRPAHRLCRGGRGLPLCARHRDAGRDFGGREGGASQAGQSPGRCGRPIAEEAADLGVRRISVGGSLARAAWGGFMRAAKEMAEQGTFTELGKGYSGGELNKMFS